MSIVYLPVGTGRKTASAPDRQTVADRVLLAENQFTEAVRLERRRTDRSGRPFMLMLLDGGEIFGASHNGVLHQATAALHGSIRDTDASGWYRQDAVLGAILTEIDVQNGAPSAIVSRLTAALHQRLDAEAARGIQISTHVYPERKKDVEGTTDLNLYPDLQNRSAAKKLSQSAKRVMDVVGSLLALALASPVFLAIAAAIKLTSKGPVFFKQERVGQYCRKFTFLKFRSMYVNNDAAIHKEYVARFISGAAEAAQRGGSVYKITNDPRVTRVGSFLRKSSLDELPQFINVLRGEMSLVGPRPPLPYESERYDHWHRRRLIETKPGITGLWQVNGRSKTTFAEMVRLDLRYIEASSLWLDLKILLQTPRAVLSGDGAF